MTISPPPPVSLESEPSDASSFRCAPWTRAQGVDPIGSALTCERIVLVETPPPWPHDISELPVFAEIAALAPMTGTRLLAVRPPFDRPTGSDSAHDRVPVTIWTRGRDGVFAGTDHLLPATTVAADVAQLIITPDGSGTPAPAEVLICGHGARDRCCGRFGTRLAIDVAGAWPGVRVRRCSHTGGHRYASTGFTLPDGLAWGFLDAAVLDQVVRRAGAPPLAGHYRGTTQLDMWAQVAERELFARYGWAWRKNYLTAQSTQVASDGRSATVSLSWDGPAGPGSALAVVVVTRDVPILVCGEPPEKAKKSSPELGLRSIVVDTE